MVLVRLRQIGSVHISQQYVVCNDVQSKLLPLTNGVPLGSVLGPLLFCLLFNSIVHSFIYSKPTLYADDTKAHCSHNSLDEAQLNMNFDLKYVEKWLAKNKIANAKMTKTMVIGSRQAIKKANKISI